MSSISLGISSTTNVVTLALQPQNTLSINTAGSVTPTSILDLTDVNASSITDGQVLVYNASTQTFIPGSAGGTDTNIGNANQTLAGVRDIEMAGNNLTFSNSDTVVHTISPTVGATFFRALTVDGDNADGGKLSLKEASANGTSIFSLSAPASLASNVEFILPSTDGSSGQFLKTDGSGNLSFAADNNTTFSVSCVDGDNSDEEKIRLTGSDGSTDDIVLEAGTGLSIARSSDKITFTNTVSDTNTQLSDEQVQDIVGAMFSGNTESDISAIYQDADGTIDLRVGARSLTVACSDETTALTTGAGKATFRMPQAATSAAVRASVTTAPAGSVLTVDINEDDGSGSGPTSILSTKLTIDAGEKTSTTAAAPVVISDTSIADDAEMTIDIDTVGSSTAGAGLKVTIYYAPA